MADGRFTTGPAWTQRTSFSPQFDGEHKNQTAVEISPFLQNGQQSAEARRPGASVESSNLQQLGVIVLRCINLLAPLLFITLAVLHIIKRGRLADDSFAQIVEQVNIVAITLWPIFFAGIASQSLKAYATFRAERGIKIMTLEQLLCSSSFASTIKQPLLFRRIDLTSLALLTLWAVSPLASQALQRLSTTAPGTASEPLNITYTRPRTSISLGPGSDTTFTAASTILDTVLLTPASIAQSPRDLWSNVKIPSLTSLRQVDSDGWMLVPQNTSDITYSSLLGRPLGNVSITKDSEFVLDSYYMHFQCTAPVVAGADKFNASGAFIHTNERQNLWLAALNSTGNPGDGILQGAIYDEDEIFFSYEPEYATRRFVVFSCNYQYLQVLAHINCQPEAASRALCQTDKMQINNDPVQIQLISPSSDLAEIVFRISLSTVTSTPFYLNKLTQYLANPSDLQAVDTLSKIAQAVGNLSADVLSSRVETLMNTIMQSTDSGHEYFAGLDGAKDESYGYFRFYTPGIATDTRPIWTIVPVWLGIFFVCAGIMLVFAVADIVLAARTISPDFLGFATSILRNNEALEEEIEGKKVGGYEKARAMAGLNVMIQDGDATARVGKIVLAPKTPASIRLHKLREYA